MDPTVATPQRDPGHPLAYRIPLGWRLLCYAFAALVVGGIGTFVVTNPGDRGMLLPALVLIPGGIYGAIYAARGRVTLTADAIEIRKAFGTYTMRYDDIAGRRVNHAQKSGIDYLRLISKSGRSLLISMPFDTDHYFQEWAKSLPDLDARDGRKRADPEEFN